ncbi:hypothetical protein KFE25_013768 [Diacronema lutheri]|uniref:Uncharacterized protein n=1 Tax=Diacronema lutheri TaxID=2081491 RepID=A0A8J5Y013_DIALT|nr:hypothetical protein KFE25_013768 [Diacronema lutheri]
MLDSVVADRDVPALAIKLSRVPLPASASDNLLLASLQNSLQPIIAMALCALRARARAAPLEPSEATAVAATFFLAASSSSHRQSSQLQADIRSAHHWLVAEQARHAELVMQLAHSRATADHNAHRKAALRASEAEARGVVSAASERAQTVVAARVDSHAKRLLDKAGFCAARARALQAEAEVEAARFANLDAALRGRIAAATAAGDVAVGELSALENYALAIAEEEQAHVIAVAHNADARAVAQQSGAADEANMPPLAAGTGASQRARGEAALAAAEALVSAVITMPALPWLPARMSREHVDGRPSPVVAVVAARADGALGERAASSLARALGGASVLTPASALADELHVRSARALAAAEASHAGKLISPAISSQVLADATARAAGASAVVLCGAPTTRGGLDAFEAALGRPLDLVVHIDAAADAHVAAADGAPAAPKPRPGAVRPDMLRHLAASGRLITLDAAIVGAGGEQLAAALNRAATRAAHAADATPLAPSDLIVVVAPTALAGAAVCDALVAAYGPAAVGIVALGAEGADAAEGGSYDLDAAVRAARERATALHGAVVLDASLADARAVRAAISQLWAPRIIVAPDYAPTDRLAPGAPPLGADALARFERRVGALLREVHTLPHTAVRRPTGAYGARGVATALLPLFGPAQAPVLPPLGAPPPSAPPSSAPPSSAHVQAAAAAPPPVDEANAGAMPAAGAVAADAAVDAAPAALRAVAAAAARAAPPPSGPSALPRPPFGASEWVLVAGGSDDARAGACARLADAFGGTVVLGLAALAARGAGASPAFVSVSIADLSADAAAGARLVLHLAARGEAAGEDVDGDAAVRSAARGARLLRLPPSLEGYEVEVVSAFVRAQADALSSSARALNGAGSSPLRLHLVLTDGARAEDRAFVESVCAAAAAEPRDERADAAGARQSAVVVTRAAAMAWHATRASDGASATPDATGARAEAAAGGGARILTASQIAAAQVAAAHEAAASARVRDALLANDPRTLSALTALEGVAGWVASATLLRTAEGEAEGRAPKALQLLLETLRSRGQLVTLIASDGVDTCAEALRRAVREADDGPDDAAAPETGMDTN